MDKTERAVANAKWWAASIAELVAALECDYERLSELRDEREELQKAYEAQFTDPDAEIVGAEVLAEWDWNNGAALAELTAAATVDGDLQVDAEAVRDRILESPLSVQVRGGWREPSMDSDSAEEFEILLSTGGPALRIMGELDQGQPCRAWLEYQDWGTGWTVLSGEIDHATLLTFCQCFYFGE